MCVLKKQPSLVFALQPVKAHCTAASQVLKASTANGRLHEVGTKDLPKWAQLYFPATRFFDQAADRWFIPFEGEDSNYPTRRAAIVELLAKGYRPEDVTRVSARSDPARVCYGPCGGGPATGTVLLRLTGSCLIPGGNVLCWSSKQAQALPAGRYPRTFLVCHTEQVETPHRQCLGLAGRGAGELECQR